MKDKKLIILFALPLMALAILNRSLCRCILYPPFLFCLVWAAAIFGLYLVGDLFYPVTEKSMQIYLAGAVAFSVGGFLANLKTRPRSAKELVSTTPPYLRLLLDAGLVIPILGMPLLWLNMRSLVSGSPSNLDFWIELRKAAMDRALQPGGGELNIGVTLPPFCSILAMISLLEYCKSGTRGRRTVAAISIAFAYNLASTGRSPVLLLLIGLLCILWLYYPRKARKLAFAGFIAFAALFVVNQIKLEKMGSRADASLSQNIPHVAEGVATYMFGGLVAFETAIQHPGSIQNNWHLYTYFIRILNKFGLNLDEPREFLEYVNVNRGVDINVYTIYFGYYSDYGFVGVAFLLCGLGFVTTVIFRKAVHGNPVAALLLGPAIFGILMTVFAESFFMELGFWLKALTIGYAVYVLAPRIVSRYYPRLPQHVTVG
jgi:oligosaccharide repeat unit polymerase